MIQQDESSSLNKQYTNLSIQEQLQLSKLYIRDLKTLVKTKDDELVQLTEIMIKIDKELVDLSRLDKDERKEFKKQEYIQSLLSKIKDLEGSVSRLRNDYNLLLTRSLNSKLTNTL